MSHTYQGRSQDMFNATTTNHIPADGYTVRLVTGDSYNRGDIVPSWSVDVTGPDGAIPTLYAHGCGTPDQGRATANAVWTRIRGGERPRGASCHANRPAVRRNPGDLARTVCHECERAQAAFEAAYGC